MTLYIEREQASLYICVYTGNHERLCPCTGCTFQAERHIWRVARDLSIYLVLSSFTALALSARVLCVCPLCPT